MPVFVRGERLEEALAFSRSWQVARADDAGTLEHAIGRRGAHCGHVAIEHHEGKPPVAFERILSGKGFNGGALLWLDPMVAWDHRVVFMGFAVAMFPAVELARGEAKPEEELEAGERLVVLEKIDNRLAQIVRHPLALQLSPRSFFVRTRSSMIAAITSSLRRSLPSSASSLRSA